MALRRTVRSGREIEYWLIEFDKRGNEVADADGVFGSEAMLDALDAGDPTDVFVLSHGWQTDFAGALNQYDNWISAFLSATPDPLPREFRPFVVCVHWPSKAFVDAGLRPHDGLLLGEEDEAETAAGTLTVEQSVDEFAAILGGGSEAREALRVILDAAASGETADAPGVPEAFQRLAIATHAGEHAAATADDTAADGEDAAFGAAVGAAGSDLTLGGPIDWLKEKALTALRQFTFWTMKARARSFGQTGGAQLLRAMQNRTGEARVHLMGHSFGSIVVSATVLGDGSGPLRPVDSLLLVQGALSLWAYAEDAHGEGRPGAFRDIRTKGLVRGPIVTTQSVHDYALLKFYPLGAKVGSIASDQLTLGDELPRFGALGTFGVQGADAAARQIAMITPTTVFKPGRIYNVDASTVISAIEGAAGAHNDISRPEIGLLAWRAALG